MYGIATNTASTETPVVEPPTLDQINYEVGVDAGADTELPALAPVEPPLTMQQDKPNANPKDQNENETDPDIPKRIFGWILLTVLSAIVLAANQKWYHKTNRRLRALASPDNNSETDMSSDARWVSAGAGIVMILAYFSVTAHFLITKYYVTQIPEGAVAFLCLGLWAAVLPVLMDEENKIAQKGEIIGYINPDFAHLYFASWGALLICLYLASSYMHEVRMKISADYPGMPRNTTFWYILLIASFVLTWSASVAYHDANDYKTGGCGDASGDYKEVCRRTSFSIFVGLAGILLTLPGFVLSEFDHFPKMVEMGGVGILFVLYCTGLAVITFENGPGQYVNNIYFATVSAFTVLLYWMADYASIMWFGLSSNSGYCSS
mmetsp:Transcript_20637/g.31793  ORF Transcript_20637/g.31793 Transcript_20637/m.31793 type:complete len:378 (-) Transcript_20637:9-1142(-)